MPTTLVIQNGPCLDITTLKAGDIIGYATQRSQRSLKILRPGKPDVRLLFLEIDHKKQDSIPTYRASWITDTYIFKEVASMMAASAGKRSILITNGSKMAMVRKKFDVEWASEVI